MLKSPFRVHTFIIYHHGSATFNSTIVIIIVIRDYLKLPDIDFHVWIFKNFCPPYWIRYFELHIFYFKFKISD